MVTLLAGNNSYARNQALRSLSADHEQSNRYDGNDLSVAELIQQLEGQSLFSESQLIVVDELSKNKATTERIDEIIAASKDGNDLVIVEPSIDKRTKFYKALKKQAELVDCSPLKPDQAISFVRDYADKQGATISASAARHLVERVGPEQQLLASEAAKLSVEQGEITISHIDELSPASLEDSVFSLTDQLAVGQLDRAIKMYRELRLGGSNPHDIIGVLAWQLEIVAIIAASPASNQQSVAKQSGAHPFVVKKNWRLASGISFDAVKAAISDMLEADIATKSSSTPDDEIIEDLLIRLSSRFAS